MYIRRDACKTSIEHGYDETWPSKNLRSRPVAKLEGRVSSRQQGFCKRLRSIYFLTVSAAFWSLPYMIRAEEAKDDNPIQNENVNVLRFTELVNELVRIKDSTQAIEKLKTVPGLLTGMSKSEKITVVDAALANLTDKRLGKDSCNAWLQIYYAMRLNDEEKIAMASRLQSESTPEKKEFVYDVVSSVPCKKGDWPDYRFDPDFLHEQKWKLHYPFIGHVYSVYPDRGFPHLVECLADVDKQQLLAAHEFLKKAFPVRMRAPRGMQETVPKHDVLATIKSLAERKEWWIRLYVAMILKKNPSYRAPDVLELLQKDENELIRLQTGSLQTQKHDQ